MKKLIILIFFLSGLLYPSYGQRTYRIKALGDKGDFIYAPHSKLRLNNDSSVKKCHHYQYIYIDSFRAKDGNYFDVLDLLSRAKYFTRRDSTRLGKYRKHFPENRKVQNGSITVGKFGNLKYSSDGHALLLRIDYAELMDGKSKTIDSIFFDLAKKLLIEFSKREGEKTNSDSIKFGWPTSISQNIVEKVFEHIPIPINVSLAGLGLQQKEAYSLLPLSPKIILKIDHSIKLTNEDDWFFQFIGSSYVYLSKTVDSENNVRFKFNPFRIHNYSRKDFSNNQFNSNENIRLSSSSIDIELTKDVNQSKYLLLFQRFNQGNSSLSSSEASHQECCWANSEICNNLILFRDNLEIINRNLGEKCELEDYILFGERSIITPMIIVYLNGNLNIVPLSYTLADLNMQGLIPLNANVDRKFRNGYKQIKNVNRKIVLNPGDLIYW